MAHTANFYSHNCIPHTNVLGGGGGGEVGYYGLVVFMRPRPPLQIILCEHDNLNKS